MIRVSVLYPSDSGKKFDLDYYVNKHMALVRQRLGDLGLVRLEVDRGLSGGGPGEAAPFVCIGHVYFDSLEHFRTAMSRHGQELLADVPNYTDIPPRIQVSEIIAC